MAVARANLSGSRKFARSGRQLCFFFLTHGLDKVSLFLLVIILLEIGLDYKTRCQDVCHWVIDFLYRLWKPPAGIDWRHECDSFL